MSPNLGLTYSSSRVSGPLGYGWTLQGMSTIARCPGNIALDGAVRGVTYGPSDKLCLDGQRLVQTRQDGSGQSLADTPTVNGTLADAAGVAGTGFSEFRTEKDSYARIRAYGYAGQDASGNSGPAYFKVWTKSGQIYEYGASPSADTNSNALVPAQGTAIPMVWAVSRISDTLGNYIDFKYIQRDSRWGSGPLGTPPQPNGPPQLGREWNLVEVQYAGHGAQAATNKVVFDYADRADNPGGPQDRAEAYQKESKNVSVWRLQAIRTYVNWTGPAMGVVPQGTSFPSVPTAATSSTIGTVITPPAGAIKVNTIKLSYGLSPTTGRSLIAAISDCAGVREDKCQPPSTFQYTVGGNQNFTANFNFAISALSTSPMLDAANGNFGAVLGDFNGDGRADILRWGNTPSDNQLWLSQGDGTFQRASNFNLTTQRLFSSDGCYMSMVADFNGDGVSDILQTPQATGSSGSGCPGGTAQLFLGNGDGSFQTAIPLTGIDLSIVKENFKATRSSCVLAMDPLRDGDRLALADTSADLHIAQANGVCWNHAKSTGRAFHVIDVNGDGILDIITTINPSYNVTYSSGDPIPSPDDQCGSTVCTHVYLGSPQGTFTEIASSLASHSVYYDPPSSSSYAAFFRPASVDVDGDGLADLSVKTGTWHSNGNGDFTLISASTALNAACATPIDFNGDGRLDCLVPATGNQGLAVMTGTALSYVAGFNLTHPGQELWAQNAAGQQTIGTLVGDFNGDGRSGILRWEDDPSKNALYLSNGDGTFRESSSFSLTGANQGLRSSDGTTSFLAADFTGNGSLEILRLKSSPSAGGEGTTNQLYARDPTPADLLQAVISSTGLKTSVSYVPLTNSASGSIGFRYSAGSSTAYPKLNVAVPAYLVATLTVDSGIASAGPVLTEFTYQGLRAHLKGRGLLGFVRRSYQTHGADGSPLTITTDYLQDHPYIGIASVSQTFNGPIGGGALLNRSTRAYCDTTSQSAAGMTANGGQPPPPCATSALIQRPYLAQALEEGWDLGGQTLPVVTTTNTYSSSGDPLTVSVRSEGDALGIHQVFTKTTKNTYFPNSIAGDSWVLGRLMQSQQENIVPNSLPSIMTGAGSAPQASATQGTGMVPAAAVVFIPGSLAWGTVGVASDSGDWPQIRNNSSTPILIAAHTTVSGPPGMWSWQGTSGYCVPGSTVLQPGTSCQTFFGTSALATPGSYSATDQISYQVVGSPGTTYTVQQAYTFSIGTSSANSSGLAFGNVGVNTTSSPQSITLTNSAVDGGSLKNLTVVMLGSQPGNFPMTHNCGTALAAGAACTITVQLSPTWIADGFSASVQVQGGYSRMQSGADSGYTPTNGVNIAVPVSGNGTGATATLTSAPTLTVPATWYGSAAQAVSATYRNDGSTPLSLTTPALAAPLAVTSNGCSDIVPGASCSMVITAATNVAGLNQSQSFKPSGAGTPPAATNVTWTTYTAVPRWSVASLAFGNVTAGGSSTQNIALFNDGNIAYNWAANNGVVSAPAGFGFNTSACGSVAAGGGSCSVAVSFSPTTSGSFGGSGIYLAAASLVSNTLAVSGTGLSPSSIAASPGTISSTTRSPTPASGSVTYANNGQTPTTLSLSVSGGSILSATSLSCPGSSVCGTVTATSPTGVGSYNGAITGATSAGDSVPVVSVNLSVQASSGTLSVSPTSLTISGAGGIDYLSSTATVSNSGPGTVGPLTLNFVPVRGSTGWVSAASDSCSGQSLASGATCTFKVDFTSGCPLAASASWNLNITGPQASNTAVVTVIGNTRSGQCR